MKTSLSQLDSPTSRCNHREGPAGISPELEDAWSRQLAAMLGNELPLAGVPVPGTSAAGVAPEPSASNPQGPAPDADVGAQSSDTQSDKRLTLTVTTPDLGQVSIVIDRAEGGLRVVLGVHGGGAEHALEPEKAALMRSLQALGLEIHSVHVVRQTTVGTVLAQAPHGRSSSRDTPGAPDERGDAARTRRPKRIQLIG